MKLVKQTKYCSAGLASSYKTWPIMKQFVIALDKQGHCFVYICTKFPNSCEKLKSFDFDGPNIKALLKDSDFDKTVNKATCISLRQIL